MTRSNLARLAALLLIAAATVLGTLRYLDTERTPGNVILASGALEGLTFIGSSAVAAVTSTEFSNSLEDNMIAIDLYLHSDTRDAFPQVTQHVERAWTAYLVADQLWRIAEDGDVQPLVADIPGAADLVEQEPTLQDVVIGGGDKARFDNTDFRAIDALFDVASRERQAAGDLIGTLEAETGLR